MTAKYQVSDSLTFSLRIQSQTLDEVVEVAKALCQVTTADLQARFANVGIFAHVYVANPRYEENQLFLPAMKGLASHFSMAGGNLTQQWRHMFAARDRFLQLYPEKTTLSPCHGQVFFRLASKML